MRYVDERTNEPTNLREVAVKLLRECEAVARSPSLVDYYRMLATVSLCNGERKRRLSLFLP
jgi:hypothetical protein